MVDSNKLAVMKFIARHKVLFCSLLLVWIIGMIFTVMLMGRSGHTKVKFRRTLHPLVHPLNQNRLPPPTSFKMAKALRYCNPPNNITLGQEGNVPGNYTLEFVAVVIRHGDRSPLRPIRNQSTIHCGVNYANPFLKEYLDNLSSVHRLSKIGYPFTTFPLHPPEKHCSSAQMTLIGSLQHLQLGHLIGKLYIDRFKLIPRNWSAEHLKIYSTAYSRTFQSAIAFLFGFLPNFDFQSFKIIPSTDTRFCINDYYCNCPLLDHLQKIMDRKMKRLLNSHPAVIHLLQRLNPIVKLYENHSDITSPMAMFDSLMGYVCHGSHLPCIPGTHNCVTIDHVRNLIAFLDWEGRQFVEDSTHKKMSWLKMHGFLMNVVQHMMNSVNSKDSRRFILYSGHDVTLVPLAAALGFDDGVIPPYASRIIFELYSSSSVNSKHKYVMKVLYNGKDVTKRTPFCRIISKESISSKLATQNLCPFEHFVRFVHEDFFKRMNASTFKAACDLSQTTSDLREIKSSPHDEIIKNYSKLTPKK